MAYKPQKYYPHPTDVKEIGTDFIEVRSFYFSNSSDY
jgi:hypothetical protein